MIVRRLSWLALTCVFAVVGPLSVYSQAEPAPSVNLTATLDTIDKGAAVPAPKETADVSVSPSDLAKYRVLQESNKRWWIITIASMTVLVLVIAQLFLRLTGKPTGRDVITCTGLVVVVFLTVLLVVVTNTEEQMTAGIGILGAVAGYLFGQVTAKPETPPVSNKPK